MGAVDRPLSVPADVFAPSEPVDARRGQADLFGTAGRQNAQAFSPAREAGDIFDDLAKRITRGILVHGFENDQDIERALMPMRRTIANTIRAAVLEVFEPKTNSPNLSADPKTAESQATAEDIARWHERAVEVSDLMRAVWRAEDALRVANNAMDASTFGGRNRIEDARARLYAARAKLAAYEPKTNPPNLSADPKTVESQATVDRGELVAQIRRYLEHRQTWKTGEFEEVLAEAMIRFFRGQ